MASNGRDTVDDDGDDNEKGSVESLLQNPAAPISLVSHSSKTLSNIDSLVEASQS